MRTRITLMFVLSLLALLLLAANAYADSGGTHVVRAGETLNSIAASHGVSATALARANGISNPNLIKIGQTAGHPGWRQCGSFVGQLGKPGGADVRGPQRRHAGLDRAAAGRVRLGACRGQRHQQPRPDLRGDGLASPGQIVGRHGGSDRAGRAEGLGHEVRGRHIGPTLLAVQGGRAHRELALLDGPVRVADHGGHVQGPVENPQRIRLDLELLDALLAGHLLGGQHGERHPRPAVQQADRAQDVGGAWWVRRSRSGASCWTMPTPRSCGRRLTSGCRW